MDAPHKCLNPLVKVIKDKLNGLEVDDGNNLDVVKLKSHKKKALLFALPNMTTATGSAYTIPNVRKGFIYNDQLDPETTTVTSLKNY